MDNLRSAKSASGEADSPMLSDQELAGVMARYAMRTGRVTGISPVADKLRELHDGLPSDRESRFRATKKSVPKSSQRNTLLWSIVVMLGLVLAGIVTSLFL